jgi:hypothetical protein
VDEAIAKMLICSVNLWSAVDADSGGIMAAYTSRGRSILDMFKFLRRE